MTNKSIHTNSSSTNTNVDADSTSLLHLSTINTIYTGPSNTTLPGIIISGSTTNCTSKNNSSKGDCIGKTTTTAIAAPNNLPTSTTASNNQPKFIQQPLSSVQYDIDKQHSQHSNGQLPKSVETSSVGIAARTMSNSATNSCTAASYPSPTISTSINNKGDVHITESTSSRMDSIKPSGKSVKFGVPIQLPLLLSNKSQLTTKEMKVNSLPNVFGLAGTQSSPIYLSDDDDNDNIATSSNDKTTDQAAQENNSDVDHTIWVDPLNTSSNIQQHLTFIMKKLTIHCWVCAQPLRTSTPTTIDINYDKHPIYLMHVHPVINCPICQYCSELVHDVEQRQQQQQLKEGNETGDVEEISRLADNSSTAQKIQDKFKEEDSVSIEDSGLCCNGCGGDENMLPDGTTIFICENSKDNDIKNIGQIVSQQQSCTRSFCQHCVAQAYGGGDIGLAKVKQLCQEDDAVKWKCLVCDPPDQLLLLHQAVSAKAINYKDCSENANDLLCKGIPRRSLDSLLWDLAVAEEEWERYNEDLTRLDEAVEQELDNVDDEDYKAEEVALRRHLVNLQGFISSLQEEAELDHNKSTASLYTHGLNIPPATVDLNNKPAYVEAAEKALAAQDTLERMHCQRRSDRTSLRNIVKHTNLYQRDDYFVDAEDLCNNNAETMDTEYCYAVSLHVATEDEMEYAFQSENNRISQMMLPLPKPVNELADEEEDRHYELEVSGQQLTNGYSLQTFGRDEYSIQNRLICLERSPILKITSSQLKKRRHSSKFNSDDTDDMSSTSTASYLTKQGKRVATLDGSNHINSLMVSDYNTSFPRSLPSSNNRSSTDAIDPKSHFLEKTGKEPEHISKKSLTLLDTTNFQNSNVILAICKSKQIISIDKRLSCYLKKHQIDGIHFMWRNSCADIPFGLDKQNSSDKSSIDTAVSGCVLAHYMGLGKSLSIISLLHTLMQHPRLWSQHKEQQVIQSVLLVAPVNTIDNWKTEFDKWLGPFDPLPIYNLQFCNPSNRLKTIERWEKCGGILLTSQFILRELLEKHANKPGFDTFLQPNLLVVDEAHMMLKNNGTKIFKALSLIKTKRKIVLTGSPFQNNLQEYYYMIDFVRPGILGAKTLFDHKYAIPIGKGMASDALPHVYYESLVQSKELAEVVRPYVDRKTSIVLQKDLPPLVDIALYVRQTVQQRDLYRLYARYKQKHGGIKFITQHAALFPVHNHPGCLLIRSENNSAKLINAHANDDQWWTDAFKNKKRERILALCQGFKIVILMHILALAQTKNEKVLIFSNCMDTLNYIEYALGLQNWKDHLPSLKKQFLGMQLGRWQKEIDYFRIDGSVSAEDRGRFVKQFNQNKGGVKAFLLSCEAGGVGINLQSASRVVLMDNHFNPAVMKQSVCRAHRLGQEKPVYCYRLLTEKTMEEKVFNRCINKTALGLRVIDEQNIERCFTSSELSNLAEIPLWVECTKCQKKRLLPSHNSNDSISNNWSCDMNVDDPINNTCSASEKDDIWYDNRQLGCMNHGDNPPMSQLTETTETNNTASNSSTLSTANSNNFLNHLLALSNYGRIISKHVFHDKLLQALDESHELEQAKKACLEVDSVKLTELNAKNLMKNTQDQSSSTPHLPGDRNMIDRAAFMTSGETNQQEQQPMIEYKTGYAYDSSHSLKALDGKEFSTVSTCSTSTTPTSNVVVAEQAIVKGENMSSTGLLLNEINNLPPILNNPLPHHFGRKSKRSTMKSTLGTGQIFDMTTEPDE